MSSMSYHQEINKLIMYNSITIHRNRII